MKIMIIRHAEPDYDNHTLTPQGFKERDALGQFYKDYKFKNIYVSPLNRALFTLEGILNYNNENKNKVNVKHWLHEFVYPIEEPVFHIKKNSWDLLPSYFVNHHNLYNNDTYLDDEIYNGSNVKEKYLEASKGLDEILAENGYVRQKDGNYKVIKESKDTILFVCHLGIMNVLLSHLLNIPYIVLCQTFFCAPTGVTLLNSEEREKGIASFRCEVYGDTSHLKIKGIENSFSGRFCEVYSDPTRH